jgi:hypothetical protein
MMRSYADKQDISLWRLAVTTVARTVLAFALPYFVAYYSVIGTWRSVRALVLWIEAVR